jgi:Uma2 family endonuclease
MVITSTQTHTAADYLELEETASVRHEYRNGDIVEMPGGTVNHNKLTLRLIFLLMQNLQGDRYEVLGTDVRLWVGDRNFYTYPDVMVVSKPVALQENRQDTVTNPVFIAEVLSDSTRNYDRSEKFAAYRTIPGFNEYLLVDQSKLSVEHHLKQNSNQWLMTEYQDPEQSVVLESLGVDLKLKDFYQNLDFNV